ncbi:uncharacterized protein ACMZJ9_005924 isoform 2-T2 [Mantella aurantiaca]
MENVNLIDLSFLTKEEQEIIQCVLKRDMDLRKREEKRIRKIRKQRLDCRCLKMQTATLSSNKTSCLTKITNLKTLQREFHKTPERCHQMFVKNSISTEECATVSDEQLSVTQILNDLEIILDLEIQNLNDTVEIADINGSSPENVLVDKTLSAVYSTHQVWHYPDLMDKNTVQANISPLTTIITDSGEDLLASKYCFLPEENVQYAGRDYLQIPLITDSASPLVCSGQLETPFCSSPNLPEPFLISENYFKYGCSSESYGNYFKVQSDHPNTDPELFNELSLDTESTLEPTIIAICDDIVPLIDATLY